MEDINIMHLFRHYDRYNGEPTITKCKEPGMDYIRWIFVIAVLLILSIALPSIYLYFSQLSQ